WMRSRARALPAATLAEARLTQRGMGGFLALGQGQVRAILFLVAVAEEVEQPGVGRDDDAGSAYRSRGVTQRSPLLAPVGRGHPGPELERRGELLAGAPVARVVEGGMALLG